MCDVHRWISYAISVVQSVDGVRYNFITKLMNEIIRFDSIAHATATYDKRVSLFLSSLHSFSGGLFRIFHGMNHGVYILMSIIEWDWFVEMLIFLELVAKRKQKSASALTRT